MKGQHHNRDYVLVYFVYNRGEYCLLLHHTVFYIRIRFIRIKGLKTSETLRIS